MPSKGGDERTRLSTRLHPARNRSIFIVYFSMELIFLFFDGTSRGHRSQLDFDFTCSEAPSHDVLAAKEHTRTRTDAPDEGTGTIAVTRSIETNPQ